MRAAAEAERGRPGAGKTIEIDYTVVDGDGERR
jgi:hypothetical protein